MNLNPLLEPLWVNAILPEIVLSVAGMALIMLEAMFPKIRDGLAPLTVIALIATLFAETMVAAGSFFGGSYEISQITQIFDFAFILAALLVTMLSREYLNREQLEGAEYYALILWGTVGMMMMGKGLDLLVVILGLEMLSICIFALLGYHRRIPVSNESSLKYFLMGAFATGFILYGTALFYGATGTTRIPDLANHISTSGVASPMITIGFVLLMAGVGFKLALAPFHGWAPDVYQGAPTPVAAWLSVAPKAATLLALIRIISVLLPVETLLPSTTIIAALSVLSMVIGNFVAIAQRDLKRMLAYSGIAHVGYMMIAMMSVSRDDAVAAISVYAITYAFMNIGAFGVISLLDKNQNDPQTLHDIAGLGFRRPFYGLALGLFMFSLAGIPPTAGFVSKFYIFKVAIESGHLRIALIGILTSIVSVYYYLRVVYYLYMKEGDAQSPELATGIFSVGALVIACVGILVIGIYPTPLFRTALNAAQNLLR